MSNIPYHFNPIPDEFLTDEFLEDIHMMRLIRYIMKRIRTKDHEEILNVNRQHKKIKLKAFEWVYGRERCAIECKTTPDIMRARITQLLIIGFIEKCPSSSTSTFTVYKVVTTAFKQINPQQFPQQIPQQFPQQFPHKEEGTSSYEEFTKDLRSSNTTTPTPSKGKVVGVVDLKAIEMAKFYKNKGMPFSEADIIKCVKEYSAYATQEALGIFLKQSKSDLSKIKFPYSVLSKEANKHFEYQQTLKELG